MKISLNWLREEVDFSGTVEELAEVLTMSGVEVEGITRRGAAFDKVVVSQVVEVAKHPNADRLSVCQVEDGSGTRRQIVTGATNFNVGDKVPLALPGAVLPGDFKIKAGKLRGLESNGMLCSAKELLLAEDSEGLLILDPAARVGAPISEVYPEDTLFDLEITPNRPDLLSHLGIAREVAAVAGAKLKPFRLRRAELNYAHGVRIAAEECPFYTARRIDGVKVGPSPAWLRERLESIGLRSINNVVDVTNFVMMERGQPLHAFDAAKLEGDLQVRLAEDGETFPALDGRTYRLRAHDLVIADDRRPAALAGVMGGQETGVSEGTTSLWLESAYFCASAIRRTSRELGLFSDSSYRFEREVDPAGLLVASQRATDLLLEVAGGAVGELRLGFAANAQFGFDAEGAVEGVEYTATVPLRLERCEELLGLEVTAAQVEDILTGFHLKPSPEGWLIPSFRPDLTREVDLIEEIARVIGLDEIPARHEGRFAPATAADREYDRLIGLRRQLAGLGFHETRTLTLVSEKALARHFAPGEAARIRNPLGEDSAILRPGLVPGLLDAVARNVRQGERQLRLFEIGRVFAAAEPNERTHAALLLSGPLAAESWRAHDATPADLFDLKGALTAALGAALELRAGTHAGLALYAEVLHAGKPIGYAGQLPPAEARALDAAGPVVFAEVDLAPFLTASSASGRYRELPRFPAVTRDIAFLAPQALTHERIASVLEGAREPLLAGSRLFDIFSDPTGMRVPPGQKSLAWSLTYRSPERTLTADEVNAVHARLKERLKGELGVQFRE